MNNLQIERKAKINKAITELNKLKVKELKEIAKTLPKHSQPHSNLSKKALAMYLAPYTI